MWELFSHAGSYLVMRNEFYLCGLTFSAHQSTMKTCGNVPSRDKKKSKQEAVLACGRGCLYSLDWTTGLTFELTFELNFEHFSFQLL